MRENSSMMGNHYLLNSTIAWAAVCISKNGCTSLKARVLLDAGMTVGDFGAGGTSPD